ncbi:transporter substrate-binding domain-containing protein [Hydrogenimonas sp.]|jgi:ABC-type amino acid transport substrate-binding protein|uniref:transporter substrate-binding domain-containing protein n=1 Tax=Hydrogenimonas sp. TaxID=2231112 RepID=UPI00260A5293|nr:transporter substrate-binding domain-containing protein [Hydrogenimonas sp.]
MRRSGKNDKTFLAASAAFLLTILFLTLFPRTLEAASETLKTLPFTPEEKAWLQKRPVLRFVYDPDWPPFEWRSDIGRHTGMIADILKIVGQKSGIVFLPVPTTSWSESIGLFKTKQVQMISAVTPTEARKKFIRFTHRSLFKIRTVLLKRFDRPTPEGDLPDALRGKTVGVVKGYAIVSYLKRRYPQAIVIEFPTVTDGLDHLRRGEIDYFAENDATAGYFIHRRGYGDLEKSVTLDYLIDLRIGLQPETPEIVFSILDKTLASISPDRFEAIYDKWSGEGNMRNLQTKSTPFLKTLPLDSIAIVIGLVLLVVLAGWYHYREMGARFFGMPLGIAATLLFAVALLVTATSLHNSGSERKKEIAHSLKTVLDVTHRSLIEWFATQRHHLNHLVNQTPFLADFLQKDGTIVPPDAEASRHLYLELKRRIREADGFLIIDRNGTILSASEPALRGKHITFPPVRRQIAHAFKEGYAHISPVRIEKDRMGHLRHYYLLMRIVDPRTGRAPALFAMRIDPAPLFNIVHQGRMGKSGETYLINDQMQMISRSRFERALKENGLLPVNASSFLNLSITHRGRPTKAAEEAVGGRYGTDVEGYPNYRGTPVLGAWRWDEILDLGVIVEIDKAEAMDSFRKLKETIYGVVFGIMALSLVLVFFMIWYARHTHRLLERQKSAYRQKCEELDTLATTFDQAVQERIANIAKEKNS